MADATAFRDPLGDGTLTAINEGNQFDPTDGYYVAQGFDVPNPDINNSYHLGVDWNGEGGGATDLDDPVFAAANGTVVAVVTDQSNSTTGFGNYIVLRHVLAFPVIFNGVSVSVVNTLYAHLSSVAALVVGDTVAIGDQIGALGMSGATGGVAHLHYEMTLGNVLPTSDDGYNPAGAPSGWIDAVAFTNENRIIAPPPVFTSGDDNVTLTTPGGTWNALGGNDFVVGTSGEDIINGNTGHDTFIGMGGKDKIYGGVGSDTFLVMADDDYSGDIYNGGAELDGVIFFDRIVSGGVFIVSNHRSISIDLTAGIDSYGNTYVSIESVVGGAGSDTITGSAVTNGLWGARGADKIYGMAGIDYLYGGGGNDTLRGGTEGDWLFGDIDRAVDSTGYTGNVLGVSGNDFLYGEGGNDYLFGGAGFDQMWGGANADVFVFETVGDIGKIQGTRDIIKDFDTLDRINLSAIDAILGGVNDQFTFVAAERATFTGVRGQLIWDKQDVLGTINDKTLVMGDINGDRIADFVIELTGLKNLNIYDFIL